MFDPFSHLSTTPYWWTAAPPVDLAEAPLPTEVDVAIVGGGYAGLGAALVLARHGRSVAVLEAEQFGQGASTVNGGMTSGSIRPSQSELTRRFGQQRADAILLEGKAAREDLYRFIAEEKIDCDLAVTGLFDGAITLQEYDALARHADLLRTRLGIEAHAVPPSEQAAYIGTNLYSGGLVRRDIGGLHPAKFYTGLLKTVRNSGALLLGQTRVNGMSRNGTGYQVATSRGNLKAGQVIVCTNGHTSKATPALNRRLVSVRSRIIATAPLPADHMQALMPQQLMYGDGRKLSYYYRPSPDGTRILFGGRDKVTNGEAASSNQHLYDSMIKIFPSLAGTPIHHSWYGQVAMNRDMIPRLFEKDGITYATGFCGSGIVWARWLGEKAAYRLLQHPEKARTAFDMRPPAAIPFYNGKPWFMPAFFAWYSLQDHMNFRRRARK